MRFFLSVLLVLTLAACASGGPGTSKSEAPITAQSTQQDPAAVSPLLKDAALASSKKTIDVDRGTVNSLAEGDGDLWARIRRGMQMPDLHSDLVDMQLDWYVQRPDYVQRMTERSQKYLYHIVEELEQRHMPTELALLPFIESAFNPQALSVAKAAGMWQFVPGTGRDYNLKQNMWQDDRRDVVASTSAALDYLSRLHDMFGDWYLALAAYNWGEGNVQRAIARNEAKGLPTDYESLPMPMETRNYVPKLQAVKDIVMDPKQYGLELPSIPNHPYFVTITTSHDIDVTVAAKLAGLSLDEFRALNPNFKAPVILGASQPQILLPFDNASVFERNLKAYDGNLSTWTTYTLTERAAPSALAQKIGVDADMLMSVNKIPAGMRLKQGSTILIPKDDNDDDDISADVAENAKLAMEPDVPDTRKLLIRVNRNQTMAAVAQRYGVTVSQLQAWNRTQRHAVSRGQVLVLHVPNGRAIRLASHVAPAHVQRISSQVQPRAARYDSNKDRAKRGGGVVRVVDHVSSDSAGSKTEKTSARTPTKAPPKSASSAGKTKVAVKSRAKPAALAQQGNAK